jgi:hypothetical protein
MAQALVRVHPDFRGLPTASSPGQRPATAPVLSSRPPTLTLETAKYPESLCPQSVLPPMGRRDPPPPRTLLPVPCSYGLMRQTLLALPSFDFSPQSESLCRLLPAPAASGFFPTLSLQIFPQMPGPLPRRSHRVLLPVSSPMSAAFPKTLWVGFPFLSANATFPRC